MKKFDPRIFMASVKVEAGEAVTALLSWRDLLRLFRLDGEDFVKSAYQMILWRDADKTGLAGFSPRARNIAGKMCVVCALFLSTENSDLPLWLKRLVIDFRKKLKSRQS